MDNDDFVEVRYVTSSEEGGNWERNESHKCLKDLCICDIRIRSLVEEENGEGFFIVVSENFPDGISDMKRKKL